MEQKHYSQAIRDEAVLFHERGHTFTETHAKYGMAESTFFEWKKRFDQAHPIHEATGSSDKSTRKAQLHLEKLALELEVIRQCPCGINASIDDKMEAINEKFPFLKAGLPGPKMGTYSYRVIFPFLRNQVLQ